MANRNCKVQALRSYLTDIEANPQTARDDILGRLEESSCPVILSGEICLCQECFTKEEHPIDSGLLVLKESSTALEQSIKLFNDSLPPAEDNKHRFRFFLKSTTKEVKNGPHKLEPATTFPELRAEIDSAITYFKAPDEFKEKTMGQKIGYIWTCVCSKLDAFQALWNLIPNNTIYTSLFCGVAKLIVQATLEYDRICLDFARCMDEICDEITSIDRVAEHDLRTQSLTCYLYAQFFVFYRAVLLWMTSNAAKKCLKSLTSSLHDELQSCVTNVRRLAFLIDRHANIAHNMIVIDMQRSLASTLGLVLRRMDQYSERQHEDMVRFYAEVEKLRLSETAWQNIVELLLMPMKDRERYIEQKHKERLQQELRNVGDTYHPLVPDSDTGSSTVGNQHTQLLAGVTGGPLHQAAGQHEADILQEPNQRQSRVQANELRRFSAEELRMSSSSLQRYIEQDTWNFLHAIPTDSLPLTKQRLGPYLRNLFTLPRPCVLWIRTQYTETYPSPVSAIAAGIVDTCLQIHVPVLAFFCNWPSVYKGSNKQERAEHCLQDLVSSVVRQLVDQLPPTIETPFDLGRERFIELETDFWGCWPYTLELLQVLLDSVTKPLFVVLDSVDHLEWSPVESRLREVVAILVSAAVARASKGGPDTGIGREGGIKILFTTAGDSSILAKQQATVPAGYFDSVELFGPRLR